MTKKDIEIMRRNVKDIKWLTMDLILNRIEPKNLQLTYVNIKNLVDEILKLKP
jgi:hypothetical protein